MTFPKQGGKRVFVSFEYRRDHATARNLINEAKGHGYPASFFDLSMRERYKPSKAHWVPKARAKIEACQVVVVIVGEDTHSAPGVEREIQLARKLGKQIVQLRPKGTHRKKLRMLQNKRIIDWDWKEIDKVFDSNYGRH